MEDRKLALFAGAMLLGMSLVFSASASADVDLTGNWTIYHSHFLGPTGQESWEFAQSGTSLTLSMDGGVPGSGTVDPVAGTFSVDFGPAPGMCGLFERYIVSGQVTADGATMSESVVDAFHPVMCQPIFTDGVGTRCLNSPLGPGEECATPEVPLAGQLLVVRDKGGDDQKRKLIVRLRDASFAVPAPGSTEDPRGPGLPFHDASLGGARLRLARGTDESATLDLPAAGWKGLGTPTGTRGYIYADNTGAGPCTRVVVRDGLIKATCKGAGIAFSLDEAAQVALSASILFGRIERARCGYFGGTVLLDSQASAGRVGVFRAKNAPVPATCAGP